MLRQIRDFLRCSLFILAGGITGCSCPAGTEPEETKEDDNTGGEGGGSPLLPCGQDCSEIETPPCKKAVCNEGQELGPLNTCVVVAASKGTACDDGVFCTSNDACDGGECVGGPPNDCGLPHDACEAVICYEESESCGVTPVNDGTACTPEDLCKVNGVCQTGECVGEPKECGFSPLNECNKVECDPTTGACIGSADFSKDNTPCVLSGDLCKVGKACLNGQCVGGTDKDCSQFDVECEIGVCDPASGICAPKLGPIGATCTDGIGECQVGTCNQNGDCESKPAGDGSSCNDHDSCTEPDQCVAGGCSDTAPVPGCTHLFQDGFESCANGWTFAGDWECGTPSNAGPPSAHTGTGVIATKIGGVYSVSQSFNTCTATSPTIDLTTAVNPVLSFWAWDHTEGGTFDGWNVKVSTDGQNFTTVTTVTPAYPLTIAQQPAWGGNHAVEGWKPYSADLTAYAGQSIQVRFAFRSDGATVYPGVYIDDFLVDEPVQTPLHITSTSPLPDVFNGMDMSVPLTRIGGTPNATWSIVGGINYSNWLNLDPATGVLWGNPPAMNVGPVSITVRVQEPTLPSNFDEATFTFNVVYAAYYASFEGACPAGWTLTSDWECGVPSVVGPATAYVGTQCIATQIDANYTNLKSFAGTTATSPDIDLTASPFPTLTWRMWIDTEGGTFDGVNLKISDDGGANYSVLDTVTPAYPLTIAGEPAWGGHQAPLGWQLMQADLSAYAGKIIRLRFAFRSDGSGTSPGVYIDDFFVN